MVWLGLRQKPTWLGLGKGLTGSVAINIGGNCPDVPSEILPFVVTYIAGKCK